MLDGTLAITSGTFNGGRQPHQLLHVPQVCKAGYLGWANHHSRQAAYTG